MRFGAKNPKITASFFAVLSLLFSVPALADCPGVCIGFAPVSAQGVPALTPVALACLALVLAVVGGTLMRKKNAGLWSLVLSAVVGLSAVGVDMKQANAVTPYTVALSSGGSNPASVTIAQDSSSPAPTYSVSVQNTLNVPVSITSITKASYLDIDSTTTLQVGNVIQAGTTSANTVIAKQNCQTIILPNGECL
jgi:hypothetical protein